MSAVAPRRQPERLTLLGHATMLEPLSPDHVPELWLAARAAPESWLFLPFGPFADLDTFMSYVRFASVSRSETLWAVRRNTASGLGPVAGWLALLDIQPQHAALELGNIWFPPGLARTRSATEAVFLLLRYVFDTLGYRRVAWKCDARHAASRAAAERFGFRFEGIARAHMIVRGGRRDTAYFSLLEDEWPARRGALTAWLDPANFDADGSARTRLERAA